MTARRLTKTFAAAKAKAEVVTALQGVSLKVDRGQVAGLVGADGAGKTTLLRIAAGLLVPTEGTVTVLGLDSARDSLAVQSRVGYMPQRFGLYEDLTVAENMDLYADLQGVPKAERRRRYPRLLAMTGLAPFPRRRAGDLSGGMKQKLGLACALIKSPQLLLLDEPTVGVDPVSRRELWKIVYELAEGEGIGVLLATAYLDEAERCHHVALLHEGRLMAEGPPRAFHDRVRGRVFLIAPPAGVAPRRIHTRLARATGIQDVTIRAGRVRLVTAADAAAGAAFDLPATWRAGMQPAEPCFEDAFMALLPRREAAFAPAAQIDDGAAAVEVGEVVVRTEGLSKYFGAFAAVQDLSFEVRRGEIFGLLGPNGAGKSTTFRMLCGLTTAGGGKLTVAGRDLRRSRARARARLGYMAQRFSLYTQLSVRENLQFYGRAYGLAGARLQARMDWAYAEFGLAAWRDRAAGELPGGYKQRLAMATALLHQPDILFLDEPTSGVDPLARREFWLRINGFAQQGVTVVVTTHFMEESEYCDRMLIMSRGRTLAVGTPEQIRALARSADLPAPTMEDAFIALAEGRAGAASSGAHQ
nr:ATP-binding cassette domain-containing protein [Desulfatitalea alkaliphila]